MADSDEFLPGDDLEPARVELAQERRRAFRRGFLFGAGTVVLGLVGVVLSVLLMYGLLMEAGFVPDSAALPAHEIPSRTLEFLIDNEIVEPGEEVLYFYSDGVFSLREDGNLFTDRRAISYWEDEGTDDILIREATYPEITGVETEYDEELFGTSTVTIELEDEDSFLLYVSNEEGLDEEFVELLVRTWERAR